MRRGILSLTLVLLPTAAAEPATAQVNYRATMSPDTVRFPSPGKLTYRLVMRTGDRPASPAIRFVYPRSGPPGPEGLYKSPISAGFPWIEGGGRIVRRIYQGIADAYVFPPPTCGRSLGGSHYSVRLRLPARTTSTLVLRARVTDRAPLPGADYRLGFAPKGRAPIQTARPRLRGPRGVRTTLLVRPGRRIARIQPSQRVTLVGYTRPPLRHRPVALRFLHHRRFFAGGERLLARVRTDARGRFRYRTPLHYPGTYELTASPLSAPRGLLPRRSCASYVQVGG